jgi:hypothetical protein
MDLANRAVSGVTDGCPGPNICCRSTADASVVVSVGSLTTRDSTDSPMKTGPAGSVFNRSTVIVASKWYTPLKPLRDGKLSTVEGAGKGWNEGSVPEFVHGSDGRIHSVVEGTGCRKGRGKVSLTAKFEFGSTA